MSRREPRICFVLTNRARIAAALIALIAWAGLAVQFGTIYGRIGSVAETFWGMAAYFTVLTNLLVGVVFTGISFGTSRLMAPSLLAGTALAIALVGAIYMLLLRGLLVLSGGDALADLILHWVTPMLVPLFWWSFVLKGKLRRYDPLFWVLYPFAYLSYALARGAVSGHYPYPFIDVIRLGWWQTSINASMIAVGFLVAGYVLVVVDHMTGRNPRA